MNKELEALEKLKLFIMNKGDVIFLPSDYDVLLKALKRNEPMKITQTSNEQDFSLFDCPNCDTTMYYESKPEDWKYCIECGQKLVWK